jgi:hypothetical protein
MILIQDYLVLYLAAPRRGGKETVGIFTPKIDSVNNNSFLETWEGIFPEIQKLRVLAPGILSLKNHFLRKKLRALVSKKHKRRYDITREAIRERRCLLEVRSNTDRKDSFLNTECSNGLALAEGNAPPEKTALAHMT